MKVCCIADNHGKLNFEVEPCDLLIHAGDICGHYWSDHRGDHEDVIGQCNWIKSTFYNWLEKQPIKDFIIVPGNHDYCFEKAMHRIDPYIIKHTLIDDSKDKIYGSPWSPWFLEWAFNAPRQDGETYLHRKYSKIPKDTQIIVSHGPPYGYGDVPAGGGHQGSSALTYIAEQLPDLRYIVTGHIHDGYGTYQMGKVTVINAALSTIVEEQYEVTRKPIYFEI